MAKSFKQKALDSMTLSELEHGRTKLDTESIIGKKLTIDKFDIVDVENPDAESGRMHYCVLVFKEMPEHFYNGGLILTKMVESWLEDFESVEQCQAAYDADSDKVKIHASMSKTNKNNKNLVKIDIV